jgi:hypothetical protein
MTVFDSPDRETCTVQRAATNTPLQPLVLWNDPTFVEAARATAQRLVLESDNDAGRIDRLYQLLLSRSPVAQQRSVLIRLLERQRSVYRKDTAAAEKLLTVGESKRDTRIDAAEHAAWTVVVQAVMSTDEVITRN